VSFYISPVSLESRYGSETVLFDADDDRDQDLDEAKVEEAIRDSEGEVNSYVGRVHDLPLPGVTDRVDPENNIFVPPELRRPSVDIAMYRMVPEHDRLTKERRRRYDDALTWLRMLVDGDVVLTFPDIPTSRPVIRDGPDRIMVRDDLDGLV
jgi:phage gp36-like protein